MINLLMKLISFIKTLFFNICASIYNYMMVFPVTKAVYINTAKKMNSLLPKDSSMIDIGTGTGLPLFHFMKETKKVSKVLAIDIDPAYVQRATKTFESNDKVNVKNWNWMEIERKTDEKFDFIFFGFSFMLMEDKIKAL